PLLSIHLPFFLSNRTYPLRSTIFPYTTLFRSKYKKLINIRYELEQNLHILKRFKYEIDENYFENVKDGIIRLSEFEPVRPKLDKDRKSTRLNSSHVSISYAVFCLKKKIIKGNT